MWVYLTVRYLIRRAWTHYRWDTRPRTPATDDLLADALRGDEAVARPSAVLSLLSLAGRLGRDNR
ncbi:hypothetical protein GCM10010353_67170 [Streptomyces chryseus]|nr:hypothetical protein GCM10010353_67170 [Streptomyces chryseus]